MDQFVALFTHRWIDMTWSAFVPCTIVLLTILSLTNSILYRRFALPEWYFVLYLAMYLAWPWKLDLRFLLPILPLFCTYIFDGCRALPRFVRRHGRLAGAVGVVLFSTVATDAVFLSLQHHSGATQLRLSSGIWIICAIISLALVFDRIGAIASRGSVQRRYMERALIFAGRVGLASFALVFVCAHTALALPEDVMVAKQNGLEVPAEKSEVNADIEAARWIATNLPANAIVMARHVPITYHYAHRKTVWFPPISSPPILMDGIRRLGVEYVLVIHRAYSYYLPADQDCFRPLQGAFRSSFTRVYAAGEFEVFKVEEAPTRDLQTRRDVSK